MNKSLSLFLLLVITATAQDFELLIPRDLKISVESGNGAEITWSNRHPQAIYALLLRESFGPNTAWIGTGIDHESPNGFLVNGPLSAYFQVALDTRSFKLKNGLRSAYRHITLDVAGGNPESFQTKIFLLTKERDWAWSTRIYRIESGPFTKDPIADYEAVFEELMADERTHGVYPGYFWNGDSCWDAITDRFVIEPGPQFTTEHLTSHNLEETLRAFGVIYVRWLTPKAKDVTLFMKEVKGDGTIVKAITEDIPGCAAG